MKRSVLGRTRPWRCSVGSRAADLRVDRGSYERVSLADGGTSDEWLGVAPVNPRRRALCGR